jgi:hypothetical protein
MKRKALLIIFVVAAIFALVKILGRSRDQDAPRFIPGTPASIPPFKWNYYRWQADTPFANDRLWMWTSDTNIPKHAYLYDLRQRTVVGELPNARLPALCSRDGSQILVGGRVSTNAGMWAIFAEIQRLFGGRASTAQTVDVTYWILDLPNNSATRVGTVSQSLSSGSSWRSSPDFRYGYIMPGAVFAGPIVVCDLKRGSLKNISTHGSAVGWWNEREIVIDTPKDEFELLNVETGKTQPLFKTADIQSFLTRSALTNAVTDIYPVSHWNGSNYDFFFAPKNQVTGLNGNGYLAKANRAGPSLDLISTNFEYRWGAVFDASGTHDLFPGKSGPLGSSGDGAVYLRNVASGTVTTIVPPDSKGNYSNPRFYGNEIIYFRDRVMHRIGLDGNGDSILLTNSITAQ